MGAFSGSRGRRASNLDGVGDNPYGASFSSIPRRNSGYRPSINRGREVIDGGTDPVGRSENTRRTDIEPDASSGSSGAKRAVSSPAFTACSRGSFGP